MRYRENHKERTRLRVLGEAAAAIRTKGAERVSVAEVMAAAGLTHGGFYAHFESKDDLIAQAITHMFDGSYDRFLRVTEGREPAAAISSYVDLYLSPLHRLERANGCPIAILSGDLPNLAGRARERFADGVERGVAALAKLAKKLGACPSKAPVAHEPIAVASPPQKSSQYRRGYSSDFSGSDAWRSTHGLGPPYSDTLLGAKDAEALAWSAMAEMAGALALSRTVSDARAAAILRNSRANVKARFGLAAR